jgi:protein AbiQ
VGKLKLYTVDMKYVRNLKNVENRKTGRTNTILSISSQTHKHARPFVGIIQMVNGNKYCIPLSSIEEKEKYKTMSENITFRKITDKNGEVIGVLNINNMIPVREEYISQFIVDELPTDSEKQREYKKKCKAELDWCNDNIGEISRLASELHTIICENKPFKKRNICPNYAELEKECAKQKIMSKRNLKKQQKVHI